MSKPQASVLALWSLGMVLARAGARTAVSVCLALLLQRQEKTVRQQLREWCYEAQAQRGDRRQARGVADSFVPLLRWGLHRWQGTQRALGLEATTLGPRFTVLASRVVYRGCAVPVAWTILPATQPEAWRRHWRRLRRQLRPAIPRGWTVIVLADRGLDAGWRLRRIVRLGWHPFWRSNTGGTVRPDPPATARPLRRCVPGPGTRWRGTGPACKRPARRWRCTLLACWEEGDQDPWLMLPDLPPEASEAGWYGLRAWIEPQCQGSQRAGWQWQRTRMTPPERAARLWLAVAVATLWLLRRGGAADDMIPDRTLRAVSAALAGPRRQRRATRLRLGSIFRRGWSTLLVAWRHQDPWPMGGFLPEPWPTGPELVGDRIVPAFGGHHATAA